MLADASNSMCLNTYSKLMKSGHLHTTNLIPILSIWDLSNHLQCTITEAYNEVIHWLLDSCTMH